MNKNIENYKKAVDQIHVDENLKDKVLEQAKAKEKSKNKPIYYLRYAVSIAAVAIVAVVGIGIASKPKDDILNVTKPDIESIDDEAERTVALDKVSIKRFKNIEELKEVLKEQDVKRNDYLNTFDSTMKGEIAEAATNTEGENAFKEDYTLEEELDYSKTNNQVENVDEADIVKTDGKYIYYTQNSRIYIVDRDLNLKSMIKYEDYSPSNIFVNGDKLVVFGSTYSFRNVYINSVESSVDCEDVSTYSKPKTFVKVYSLTDIENPELLREINVDGYYDDARMIENNIYFVTNYDCYYYKELDQVKDEEILPCYEDTAISDNEKCIAAHDIARFDDIRDCSYSLVAGFCLDNEEEVNIETFFGFGGDMYVSENNMYLICNDYSRTTTNTIIYKFKLENATVLAQCSCEVEGYTNNQFSLDEYDGNLRVATTISKYNELFGKESETVKLTIFNENLEKIGGIDNLIKDESIYAVRFIGKVGYIVTFEQIDPLWVIDLSDPTNPVVKGELEIPGYSSYLHPYDETHIIGIGYDVKDNGYGGITNDKIKLSMFDVSDLENPKEIFKVNFDNSGASSSIMYDHKSLFFNKQKNLIGIPISVWGYSANDDQTGFLVYKIDFENNKFEEIDSLLSNHRYSSNRALYIGEYMYILYPDAIDKIDLNTFEVNKSIELENSYDDWVY